MNKCVLIIAGSDSGGGAGIQGDIKTLSAFRVYSATAVTSITAQNTTGISAIFHLPMDIVGQQIEAVAGDIDVHAVKIGMLGSKENIRMVASMIKVFKFPNIVIDPVLKSSSGTDLIDKEALEVLKKELFPLADVVTPNIEEASFLSGLKVSDVVSMKSAAEAIYKMGPKNVIITGGHLPGRATDVLFDGIKFSVFDADRNASNNTHGLGCAFSAVLAAKLASHIDLPVAVETAKKYIAKAMNHPFKIGKGPGPINHSVPV